MKTVFLRALDIEDKAQALRVAIRDPAVARGQVWFELSTQELSVLPKATFAYWVGPRIRALFADSETFAETAETRRGMATLDDFRFIRLRWEVAPNHHIWNTYSKGDTYRPFFETFLCVVNWRANGKEAKAYVEAKVGSASRTIQAQEWYFKPGLTWVRRTHRLCMRVLPRGIIFSGGAQAVFAHSDDEAEWFSILALVSSSVFDALTKMSVGRTGDAVQFEPGMVARVPLPSRKFVSDDLGSLARQAWLFNWRVDTAKEISHTFTLPALLQAEGDTLVARASAWADHVRATEVELSAIQDEIDRRCFDLYGIDETDRRAITEGFARGADKSDEPVDSDAEPEPETDDESDAESNADGASLTADLISWAVGAALGRFDMRLATDARALPTEPEPFDPLPVCPPAMLTGDDGLPLTRAPAGYPLPFPENGMLVDDPGQASDLTAAVRKVFNEVFTASADACWNEATALLDPQGQDLRAWLASSFFEHHLKRHSKSRRKAPVLWQLSVASGRYSIWLYAHRLTRDSFFQLQNDVAALKLAHEERQLTSLVQGAGDNPSAKERNEIAAQEAYVEELRAMLDEVKRVAPFWNPTLDDGVVLTMAPLWRLVPQHKPWQKELKSKWDELTAGKYDWAHLAMHLWPERVVPKCATDRSLAIAHGLEAVFWDEGDDGKWKPRSTPTRTVEELVRERTSSAVKAALKSLLEASAANGNGGRARGRRVANAVADRGAH